MLQTLLHPLTENPPHISSYPSIFQFLTGQNFIKLGQQVHSHMVLRGLQPNAFVASKMVAMYASAGDVNSAIVLFDSITSPSSLLYNSIIRAYTWYGFCERTSRTYLGMHLLGLKGDCFIYPFVLKSCADLAYVGLGKCVHGLSLRTGLEFDMYVGTSLIDMYVKCGELSDAHKLFNEMPVRDVSSWNALIAGHMKDSKISNGLADRALGLFDEMLQEDSEVKPNWVTIMIVLPACAHSAALECGRQIHNYASEIGLGFHSSVETALAAMYARCGSFVDAQSCFDRIRQHGKSLVTWNTVISAYASHGHGTEAVSTFEDMIRAGILPDAITFTDLLGRAGRLVEAYDLISQMPMQAGPSICCSVLAASRSHQSLEIEEIAARKLFVLESDNSGNYVLLSNMYADVGMWEEVNNLRTLLKLQCVKKSPGCSWIEINGKAHLFLGGDLSHPQAKEIYMLLEALPEKIKSAGYVPDTNAVLHDVSEEEKEHYLTTHSEKLAIAFGLLNTSHGTVL
ncbi:unnamed protein product [Ilex paraguariensis]|uniref:DYW domain-containing protein n=1 Tax=Ilex paraguariensis TaxID=185542 RepID=A0ABC8S1Q3_9AQUA